MLVARVAQGIVSPWHLRLRPCNLGRDAVTYCNLLTVAAQGERLIDDNAGQLQLPHNSAGAVQAQSGMPCRPSCTVMRRACLQRLVSVLGGVTMIPSNI